MSYNYALMQWDQIHAKPNYTYADVHKYAIVNAIFKLSNNNFYPLRFDNIQCYSILSDQLKQYDINISPFNFLGMS